MQLAKPTVDYMSGLYYKTCFIVQVARDLRLSLRFEMILELSMIA